MDCGKGPKCQRFAAIVEDGILMKLVRPQLQMMGGVAAAMVGWGIQERGARVMQCAE